MSIAGSVDGETGVKGVLGASELSAAMPEPESFLVLLLDVSGSGVAQSLLLVIAARSYSFPWSSKGSFRHAFCLGQAEHQK